MTQTTALDQALAAIERPDHARALVLALEAWNACRHERIAAVIEELGARLAKTRKRPSGNDVHERQVVWTNLAAKHDPADIDGLLATLTEVKKGQPLVDRLAELARRPDPRIAKALVAFVENPPVPGSTGIPPLNVALGMLIAIADPRTLPAIEQLGEAIADVGGGLALRGLRTMLRTRVVELRDAIAKQPATLSVQETKVVAAIEDALAHDRAHAKTAGSAEELFAAVYAKPDDDGARSVLADFLQERDDPRGELIALQLARAAGGPRTKRESELLRTHAREWLGPLAPVVLKTDLAYERGFLAKCAVRANDTRAELAVTGRPEWATVREVDVTSWFGCEPLVAAMPVLRALRGLRSGLDTPSHPTVEDLQIVELQEVGPLVAAELPALRELEIKFAPSLAEMQPFWKSPLAKQLERFAVGVSDLEGWIPFAATRGLIGFDVYFNATNPWRLRFEADAVHAELVWTPSRSTPGAELARCLALVPSPRKWRVVVAGTVRSSPALAAVKARFASFELAKKPRPTK